jgi:DNA repair protein RadD
MEFKRTKKDPTQMQTDEVLSMDVRDGVSQNGNKTVRADFVTPWRSFSVWFMPEGKNINLRRDYLHWCVSTDRGSFQPKTVTYRKDAASGFYRVFGYNRDADHEPE